MKYIRTKDGEIHTIVRDEDISKEEKAKCPDNCILVYANNIFGCSIINENKIIKQADTIEELCDEFVYCKMLITKEDVKEILNSEDYKCKEIYGAIWVFDSNGTPTLKSVAKMNENGDLELL